MLMTTNGSAKFVRCALWFSPLVVVPAAFLASVPWLRQQDTAIALGIAAAVAVLVMGYSFFLTARATRRLDEVEIAGQRFAQAQGWTIGIFASGLAMVFPPAMNALADLANYLANTLAGGSADVAVRAAIVIGFVMVVILQGLGMFAASIWWGRRLAGQA
jgi:hypothetical protein